MQRMLQNEFNEYYSNTGYFPLGMYTPKKKLNERQLDSYYKKYCTKIDKIVAKREDYFNNPSNQDSLMDETKEAVSIRDGNKCRLWKTLTKEERSLAEWHGYNNYFVKKLTFAHCIRRSKRKDLINDIDNVYQVSLLFHHRLDFYQNPLTGKSITKEETSEWWKRIINDVEVYNYLTKE